MQNENNDDIQIDEINETELEEVEEVIDEEETENASAYIKKLKAEIKTLKTEKADMLLSWQKDKADFINARKRDEESRADAITFANGVLINELLPVVDNYEQAKLQPGWSEVPESWRRGVESMMDKLIKSLEKYGLASYGSVGDLFDPKLHEALGTETTEDASLDQKVSFVLQKGYKLHTKVLKPALVKIYNI